MSAEDRERRARNLALARTAARRGECPGCSLPFTQVSVEGDNHSRHDGSLCTGDHPDACWWDSSDLYSMALIAEGVVSS